MGASTTSTKIVLIELGNIIVITLIQLIQYKL
jgi:hypothetical protein